MGFPAFLVENLLSTTQFQDNLVTADEDQAGHEAELVGRASRLAGSGWIPPTTNIERKLQVQCRQTDPDGTTTTQPRYADIFALDRNTNLRGFRVILEGSFDGFATAGTTIFDVTIPKVPGGTIDGALGCVTREKAWLKAFSGDAFPYWRLRIPAMGAGLAPQVGHAMLGRLWRLKRQPRGPSNDQAFDAASQERELESLWIGAGRPRSRRALDSELVFQDFAEGEQAEYHVAAQFYAHRRPAWYIHDLDEPERAALYVRRPGRFGFGFENQRSWPYRVGQLVGVEHEPLAGGA